MDRFIARAEAEQLERKKDLKSNMDRFIDPSSFTKLL